MAHAYATSLGLCAVLARGGAKPRSLWANIFNEDKGITTVNITLQQDNFADIELMIKMGFKEGFAMALKALDNYFETK